MLTADDMLIRAMKRGHHEAYGIMRTASPETARRWADESRKPATILHGDDGRFWVCTGMVVGLLARMGYERAGF